MRETARERHPRPRGHLVVPFLFAVVACVPAAADPAGADPRVRAGNRFVVDYPGLPSTLARQPSAMHVSIPTNYDPNRQHPLLLWLNTGEGQPGLGDARGITGGTDFVCVSLPLYRTPEGMAKPGISGILLEETDLPLIWTQYRIMLGDLERMIPNLHPTMRVVGGGSNGAHAAGGLISGTEGEFCRRFHHALFWEGGYLLSDARPMAGGCMMFCWGANSQKARMSVQAKQAADAGVDVETIEMPGVGHDFPLEYHARFRDWLDRKILYAGLPEALQALRQAMGARRWGDALRAVRDVRGKAHVGRPERTEAEEAFGTLCNEGARALDTLKTGTPGPSEWCRFVQMWDSCPCADEARQIANPFAEQELEKILALAGRPRETGLRRYLETWIGFAACGRAREAFDADAAVAYEALTPRAPSGSRPRALRQFIEGWNGSAAVERAREELEAIARAELDEILAITNPARQRHRLEAFARAFDGTDAAREAFERMK
ncbi:MAG: hypothetical protein HY608_06615 [Planctomycetes bacterium]|nr:hypothetical protein [Planctomycetota bacterium]